jgi:hypothetical protein
MTSLGSFARSLNFAEKSIGKVVTPGNAPACMKRRLVAGAATKIRCCGDNACAMARI